MGLDCRRRPPGNRGRIAGAGADETVGEDAALQVSSQLTQLTFHVGRHRVPVPVAFLRQREIGLQVHRLAPANRLNIDVAQGPGKKNARDIPYRANTSFEMPRPKTQRPRAPPKRGRTGVPSAHPRKPAKPLFR